MSEWRETEIGRIPSEWKLSTLGEISQLLTDGAHLSPKPIKSQFYMASVKDMRYNYFDFSECKTISEADFNQLINNNCSPNYGDILLSKDGANCLDIMFVYKQKEKIVLLSSIAIVRLKEEYDPDFYRYFLLSPNVQDLMKNNYVSGSAIPRVILKDFKNVPIPLVPIKEQKAIAEVLSSLDDKIDLLHRQNKTLEELAQTLFRQWFIEEAKDEWEVTTLGNIGKAITGKTPSTKNEEFWGNELFFITPTDFKNYGKYAFDSERSLSNLGKEKVSKIILPEKAILVTCIGSDMGKVAVAQYECVSNQQINSLILDNEHLHEYVYQYLKYIYPLLRSMAMGGTTMPIINKTDFENIEIPLPSSDLIASFHQTTLSFNEKIIQNTNQIKSLENMRDTLLPKLMSGEVRVKI